MKKIRECIALLDSMVRCGEQHSPRSEQALREAREELDELEDPEPPGLHPFEADLLEPDGGDW